MFHINVLLTVSVESDIEEIRSLLAQCASLSRQEPGCERFEVYHSQSDPKVFLLCEWWQSEQAWQVHRNEKAVQEIYLPKVLPRVTRTPHISTLVE
jgi:quinol monooxygenase YgiN